MTSLYRDPIWYTTEVQVRVIVFLWKSKLEYYLWYLDIFLWNGWGLQNRWIKGVKVDTHLCPLEVLKILWKPENVGLAKCHTRISNQYINQIFSYQLSAWIHYDKDQLTSGSIDPITGANHGHFLDVGQKF